MVIQAKKVVRSILDRAKYQREFVNYYDGKQPLTFTTRKYRDVFAEMVAKYQENMCPAVVDALTERLEVLGLEVQTTTQRVRGCGRFGMLIECKALPKLCIKRR
jgi:hypothetical protein